jgi:hypothetical protein
MLKGGQAPISVDSKPRAFARLWAIVRPAAAKPDHKSVEAVWFLSEAQETLTRANKRHPVAETGPAAPREGRRQQVARVLAKAAATFSVPI